VESLADAEEPGAKRTKVDVDGGPTGSGAGLSCAKIKYSTDGPGPDLPHLRAIFNQFGKTEKTNFLYASLARSTWNRYEVAVKWFKIFCREIGTKTVWPTNEEEDRKFLSWLGTRKTRKRSQIALPAP